MGQSFFFFSSTFDGMRYRSISDISERPTPTFRHGAEWVESLSPLAIAARTVICSTSSKAPTTFETRWKPLWERRDRVRPFRVSFPSEKLALGNVHNPLRASSLPPPCQSYSAPPRTGPISPPPRVTTPTQALTNSLLENSSVSFSIRTLCDHARL